MFKEDGVNPSEGALESVEPAVRLGNVSTLTQAPPPYSPLDPNVVTAQPSITHTIYLQAALKSNPVYYTCVKCNDRILTRVKHKSSAKTHMIAGFCIGLTCWCCICCVGLLPYYFKTFKITEHYCPYCETLLGSYSLI